MAKPNRDSYTYQFIRRGRLCAKFQPDPSTSQSVSQSPFPFLYRDVLINYKMV